MRPQGVRKLMSNPDYPSRLREHVEHCRRAAAQSLELESKTAFRTIAEDLSAMADEIQQCGEGGDQLFAACIARAKGEPRGGQQQGAFCPQRSSHRPDGRAADDGTGSRRNRTRNRRRDVTRRGRGLPGINACAVDGEVRIVEATAGDGTQRRAVTRARCRRGCGLNDKDRLARTRHASEAR
jgi:hypothetical protein